MQGIHCSKGASRPGALFRFCCLLIAGWLITSPLVPASADGCPARNSSEQVEVVHVYDGDTVKLKDGRRLRLIGINTPENVRKEQPEQPFAREATAALRSLVERHNRRLRLQYGKQHRDHYGRLLAHAFLQDGSNVAVSLLQRGLATTLVVPPNSWAADCYQRIEDQARADRLGIWALPGYQSIASSRLHPDDRGFRIVHGRVEDIRQARHSIWLQLGGPLAIRISRKDLVNFPQGYLDGLRGQTVELRGWLKADNDKLRVTVRHPAALLRISNAIPG